MEQQNGITRKKALKFMTLGSATALFAPALFTTSCAANGNGQSRYLAYEDIFTAIYPFTLKPLPYAADALEPAIDARTMEIHHGRHHNGYINNLNSALENHSELQAMTLSELVAGLNELPADVQTAVRNHGGGHLNHLLFWNTMTPGGSEAAGSLADAINRDFGSVENLKEEMLAAAGGVFGSGWAWLAADNGGFLSVVQTPNQDNPLTDGLTPLTGVDVWEHAYYLNYQNLRRDYVNAWLNLVHWEKVSEMYEKSLEA